MTRSLKWWPSLLFGAWALAGLAACEADLETRCVGGDGSCDAANYVASASSTSGGATAGPGGTGSGGGDGVGGAGGG